MNKNGILKKQQFSFMFLNFIAFTVIFAIFGIIIFTIVQNTLYSQVDKELLSFKERIGEKRDMNGQPPPLKGDYPRNLRIIQLKWNKDLEIMNQDQIGLLYYENYFKDVKPDVNNLNQINKIVINENHFRSITVKNEDNNGEMYTQLIINVDAEQTILNNFEKILIVCIVVAILLSISASYLLSKKTMNPIITSWKRQLDFVENASHELRTPLTIIQNKLELLLTAPNAKIMDKFENIALSLSETRRLSKLTADLLTLARADSSETQLVKKKFDLDSFIEEICLPYSEIAELQEKTVSLDLQSKASIVADKSRIHQLLVILIDNALKYTSENDKITIRTVSEENKVIILVCDTGIGISDENKKRIFDRFYREDKARTREKGGVGLGLSIAQWIVSSHNGSIKVENNGGKGTIFKIKLPKM
ncbi:MULTISPECIES: sensor histidine kinase [Bacillus]|uniref:sensor histidine kinase n=1 Tax=Bacillus TaxID=1386 RepID=UPI000362FAFD|nr:MULTISPECIES: ATP-binding protein [Bacillus]